MKEKMYDKGVSMFSISLLVQQINGLFFTVWLLAFDVTCWKKVVVD